MTAQHLGADLALLVHRLALRDADRRHRLAGRAAAQRAAAAVRWLPCS